MESDFKNMEATFATLKKFPSILHPYILFLCIIRDYNLCPTSPLCETVFSGEFIWLEETVRLPRYKVLVSTKKGTAPFSVILRHTTPAYSAFTWPVLPSSPKWIFTAVLFFFSIKSKRWLSSINFCKLLFYRINGIRFAYFNKIYFTGMFHLPLHFFILL